MDTTDLTILCIGLTINLLVGMAIWWKVSVMAEDQVTDDDWDYLIEKVDGLRLAFNAVQSERSVIEGALRVMNAKLITMQGDINLLLAAKPASPEPAPPPVDVAAILEAAVRLAHPFANQPTDAGQDPEPAAWVDNPYADSPLADADPGDGLGDEPFDPAGSIFTGQSAVFQMPFGDDPDMPLADETD